MHRIQNWKKKNTTWKKLTRQKIINWGWGGAKARTKEMWSPKIIGKEKKKEKKERNNDNNNNRGERKQKRLTGDELVEEKTVK